MIIDLHRHTMDQGWMTRQMWTVLANGIATALNSRGRAMSKEQVAEEVLPTYCDTHGQAHIRSMDRAGIAMSIMAVFDVGPKLGDTPVPVAEQNQVVFQISRRYPERIIPFVGIDPRRIGALEFFEHAITAHGARGLKLHPGAGFDPKDRAALDMAACAEEHGLPILIHTGPNAPPSSSEFAGPEHLIPMLKAHPGLKIIAAHLSLNHKEELLAMAPDWPNLYADISAWQQVARENFPRFARSINQAVRAFGPGRVVFGTDAPFRWPNLDDHEFVSAVQDLATPRAGKYRLEPADLEMILGGNARQLLGL